MKINPKYFGIEPVTKPTMVKPLRTLGVNMQLFEVPCFYDITPVGRIFVATASETTNPRIDSVYYDPTTQRPVPFVQFDLKGDFQTPELQAQAVTLANPIYQKLFGRSLSSQALQFKRDSLEAMTWRWLRYDGKAEYTPAIEKGKAFDRWTMIDRN